MPSESDNGERNRSDDSADRRSVDDHSPEERARAAADAIETIGVDRLTDLVVEAWEEGGLPPFDEEDQAGEDESARPTAGDETGGEEPR
jgi:hypothetical protein